MSHVTAWVCRTCRSVLGHVRDGVLAPIMPVGRGVARLPCPGCGRIRVWLPLNADGAKLFRTLGSKRYPGAESARAWPGS
jgi:hypothetical protein